MVELYLLAGSIVLIGFVWFWIVRPIVVSVSAAYADWRTAHEEQPRHTAPARRRRSPARRRVMSRPIMRTPTFAPAEPEPKRSSEIPLLNGAEPQTEPFVIRPELHLNADELAAVARMIDHNRTAAKPSKSSTIGAGFGVSRGGSAAYTRASLIYDALFGPSAPAITYRELSPEQEAVRAQLRMKQKGALN